MTLLHVFAPFLVVGALASGCGAGNKGSASSRPAPAADKTTATAIRQLARNGVSIAVPMGWDGRMLFRDAAGSRGVIFQVANFGLPPNEGFEPPRELPPGREDPIKAMDAGDALVTVSSDEASGEPGPATVALADLRFLPADAPRVPRGHALAERSFCNGSRCIRVEADFGRGRPAPTLRNEVDAVLASLEF